jgi:hypothetical protein
MEAFSQSDSSVQVAEATTQGDPNTSGSKSQKAKRTKILFIKNKFLDEIISDQK